MFRKLQIGQSYWQQDISRREYLFAAIRGLCIAGGIGYLFYESVLFVLLLLPLAGVYFYGWLAGEVKRRREQFLWDFRESLQCLRASLDLGYSVENSIRETARELARQCGEDVLIRKEFAYMSRQIEMNVPAEQVLREFAQRTQIDDVRNFVTVFSVAKRSGGEVSGILKQSADQICDKVNVKREIQTVTAAKRLEFKIMAAVPLGMILYIKLSFSEFVSVLYGNLFGMFLMSCCLATYMLAYWIGRNIIEIEV